MFIRLKKAKQNTEKMLALLLAFSMSATMLAGCSELELPFELPFETLGDAESDTSTELVDLDDNVSDIIIVEKVEELDDKANIPELPAKDLAEASAELVSNEGPKYYAYDQLNDEEKVLYTEIYSIISTLAKDTKVSSTDPAEIEKAFNYVMLDHPEIFYLTGYSFTKYMRGGNIEKITLSGNYTMSAEEAEEKSKLVDEYVENCKNGYNGPVDDYEKVKYVYEYLIKNNEYDMAVSNNQNVLSVVMDNRTVCQGYAKATQLILNRMGVFCILCEGIVKGTESHVWNIVKIDDEYYHVDTTWGDASYMVDEEAEDFETPEINYDFLCITDDEIKETHVFKDGIDVPECNSMRDNYYVREGLYLAELDTEIIRNAFDKAREKGENIVTLKCANANVYSALYNHLVENHGIFDYLNGSTTVNYVQFRDNCRISFYI